MAKDILRNRHASVKFAKENNMEWLELESEYVWVYLLAYLAVLFFQKKIKISDDTTSSLPTCPLRREFYKRSVLYVLRRESSCGFTV